MFFFFLATYATQAVENKSEVAIKLKVYLIFFLFVQSSEATFKHKIAALFIYFLSVKLKFSFDQK